MNLRSTGWLVLVAALLGGFIYFYELEGESSRQAVLDAEASVLPGLESDAIDQIGLSTQDGVEARFERLEGRWRMTSPIESRADSTALDAMANALAGLSRAGRVSNPGSPEEYGLGPDTRTIRFVADGKPGGLRIGRRTPVGGHVYVARLSAGGDDQDSEQAYDVEYVESYRINAFNRKLEDLRDRRIVRVDGADLLTLRVTWSAPGGPVEVALARDAAGDWQMGVPAAGAVDQHTLRDLISNLSFLRATDFIDLRTDEGDAALANPAMSFHWTLPGDHAERRLRIGSPGSTPSGEDERTLVEGPEGQRFTIDTERLNDFPREVVAYRFKTLSEFALVDAHHFRIEFAEEGESPFAVEARLGKAGWSGAETRIDPDRASDLIRAMTSLHAVDILADEMGAAELASLGLSPARVRIQISGPISGRSPTVAAGSRLAEVAIGRLDPGRGLFAQRVGSEGTSAVYVLPASVAAELPISRAAFEADFAAAGTDSSADGTDLESEDLEIDPLEGVEIP